MRIVIFVVVVRGMRPSVVVALIILPSIVVFLIVSLIVVSLMVSSIVVSSIVVVTWGPIVSWLLRHFCSSFALL